MEKDESIIYNIFPFLRKKTLSWSDFIWTSLFVRRFIFPLSSVARGVKGRMCSIWMYHFILIDYFYSLVVLFKGTHNYDIVINNRFHLYCNLNNFPKHFCLLNNVCIRYLLPFTFVPYIMNRLFVFVWYFVQNDCICPRN